MSIDVANISRYAFGPSDKLLLDANVWLIVLGPQRRKDRRTAIYSEAFDSILKAKSQIYIDVLVLSEFINTYARLKWRVLSLSTEFKEFRKSADFKPVAQDIAADVRLVLRNCSRVDSGFDSLAIDALLDEYAAGDSDFNDQVLTGLCAINGLKMVTDDADFRGRGIPVITANRRLLS